FQIIVGKVGQPGRFFSLKTTRHAQFILVYPPRDTGFLQSFRKGFPPCPFVVRHISIVDHGFGFTVIGVTECSRPQLMPVGSSTGATAAKMLTTHCEGIGQGIIECDIISIMNPHSEWHMLVILVARLFSF